MNKPNPYYDRHHTTGSLGADQRMKRLRPTVCKALTCIALMWLFAWFGQFVPVQSTLFVAYAVTALPSTVLALLYGGSALYDLLNYWFGASA